MQQLIGPNPYMNVPVPSLVMPEAGQCNYSCVRKEFHRASQTERNNYIWAIRKLMESNGNSYSPWEQLSKEHFTYASLNHNSKSFYPWHRLYLARIEATLQKIDPSVCLLYWDWSYESQNWKQSQIWSENMLGMGGVGSTQCISGPFADIRLKTATHPSGCISRGFGTSVFYATAYLSQAHQQYNTYQDWEEYWEVNPHAVIHRYVGGDMQTQYSPNDPLFYLHHGTVDLYWWKFQGKLAALQKPQYGGLTNGEPVSLDDVLVPYPNKVKTMMEIKDFCYSYDILEQAPETNIKQPQIPVDFLKNNGFTDAQIHKLSTSSNFNDNAISNAMNNNITQIPAPTSAPSAKKSNSSVSMLSVLWLVLVYLL